MSSNTIQIDPTGHRLRREALESQEGTPRSLALTKIEACEFSVTCLLDAAKQPHQCAADLDTLADAAYSLLNEAYLYLSPEGPTLSA